MVSALARLAARKPLRVAKDREADTDKCRDSSNDCYAYLRVHEHFCLEVTDWES